MPAPRDQQERARAQEPLATNGNFLHIHDFRVAAGLEDDFIRPPKRQQRSMMCS